MLEAPLMTPEAPVETREATLEPPETAVEPAPPAPEVTLPATPPSPKMVVEPMVEVEMVEPPDVTKLTTAEVVMAEEVPAGVPALAELPVPVVAVVVTLVVVTLVAEGPVAVPVELPLAAVAAEEQ